MFVPSPSSFVVEEIPAYVPSGEGEHTFIWIEKRDLTTPEAVRRVARHLGVEARDVGYAGMKDRHALTRQWLSVPRVDPERALSLADANLVVLQARRHGNKLRLGHLAGNRFEVVLTGDDGGGDGNSDGGDLGVLRARLESVAAAGVANFYGAQRFGASGDNAAAGLAILRGERRERDHRRRKLLLSAAQAAVFNQALALRAASGGLSLVRAGDVLQKTGTGGLFVSTDPAVDQARVDAGEVIPTGPLPGTREREPPPGTPARDIEDRALAAAGATREDFARAGRDLPGARRPVLIRLTLGDPPLAREPDDTPGRVAVRARFSLPAGSYATVVVALLTQGPAGPQETTQETMQETMQETAVPDGEAVPDRTGGE
jgi:tRNA pseudouridine13 synthase